MLAAATEAGIEIPTLCFLRGYEPSTSCQVCLVKDCTTQRFLPACATMVTDGMMVESESHEVRHVRRTALELLLSEHVGDCLAPCFFACPAHMDIPLMLEQIEKADLHLAIATVKRDIALPATLGRVCSKPCEKGCRRQASDDAVAVCELKRYVADADLHSEHPFMPACRPDTGQRVAIVGAGPTGLSAAYYLRQRGHQCVLIEQNSTAGGRLRDSTGLPGEILDAEIAQILRIGVRLQVNQALADAEAFAALRREFDAVLLACGEAAPQRIQRWGLRAGKRGIAVNRETFQTELQDVFAAGTRFAAMRWSCEASRTARRSPRRSASFWPERLSGAQPNRFHRGWAASLRRKPKQWSTSRSMCLGRCRGLRLTSHFRKPRPSRIAAWRVAVKHMANANWNATPCCTVPTPHGSRANGVPTS